MTPSDQTQLDAQLQRLHLQYVQSHTLRYGARLTIQEQVTETAVLQEFLHNTANCGAIFC